MYRMCIRDGATGGSEGAIAPPTIILEGPCPLNVAQEKDKKSEGNIYIAGITMISKIQ